MLPVVVFAFSKKLCEECAEALHSLDMCNNTERSEISRFLEGSICRLSGSDRRLPQARVRAVRRVITFGGGRLANAETCLVARRFSS